MSVQDGDTPPTLSDEVWRGQDNDGDWCAVSGTDLRVWLCNADATEWREFRDPEMHSHVYLTWALSERARADKAEREAVRLQAFADLAHDAAERKS